MLAPSRVWWKPFGRLEKSWLIAALVWCIFMTIMMPLWFFYGRQNVPTETYRITAEAFNQKVSDFVGEHQIGEESGIPIVAPPPGSDVYLRASQFQWYPILQLEQGETYRLHLSSTDVQHGFSLQPVNINLQLLPGYDYVATIVPTTRGEFTVVCNEFCSLGHHVMTGKLIVVEK